jgi:hypothetical protein
VGHSRRYCHVRSLVRYPQHRTLPRPTETHLLVAFLRPICKQQVRPPQLLPLASLDLATRHGRAVTKGSAYRLQRTCAESAAAVVDLFFCPIAVWRRIAQRRRGGYRRDYLRALAQRVVVGAQELRIMGSKSELLRTLVAASSAKTAGFGVPSSVPKVPRHGR